MQRYKVLSWSATALAAVAFGVCLGCSASKPSSEGEDPEAAHIAKVGILAGEYAKAHNNEPPKSVDALKKWAVANKGATDEDFVSTRDQKEYTLKILGQGAGARAVIFEQEGKALPNTHLVYQVNQGSASATQTDERGLQMMQAGSGPSAPSSPLGGPGGQMRDQGFHPGNPGSKKGQ